MTHVADYMRETTGVWMWEFKYNHLMETTSNPVESCMSWIQKDLFGLGNPRDKGLFNSYRLLTVRSATARTSWWREALQLIVGWDGLLTEEDNK